MIKIKSIGLLAMLAAFNVNAQFLLLDIPMSTNRIAEVTLPDKVLVTTNTTAAGAEANMTAMLRSELQHKLTALNKATCDFYNQTDDRRPRATNANITAIVSALSNGHETTSLADGEWATSKYWTAVYNLSRPPVDRDPVVVIGAYISRINSVHAALTAAQ